MEIRIPNIGDFISVIQRITEEIISNFARTSSDRNFLHIDPGHPACARTKTAAGITGMIGHGAYMTALASGCVASLCGPVFLLGEIGVMRFIRPVPVGSIVCVSGKISKIDFCDKGPDKKFYKCVIDLTFALSTGEVICAPTSAVAFIYV